MGQGSHTFEDLRFPVRLGDTWELGPEEGFVVDGVTFRYGLGPGSAGDRFFVAKTPEMLDGYRALAGELEGATILELGIATGGSTAWMALEFAPALLVAVDIADQRVPALDELIAARDLGAVVRPHFSVDQSDADHLRRIVADEVGDRQLDVVIDDASHLLGPTRTSFETLFPLLRPGGLYVIEDWSWEHRNADLWDAYFSDTEAPDYELRCQVLAEKMQDPSNLLVNLSPLSDLAVELTLALASAADVVAAVSIDEYSIVVRRGPAPVDPIGFRVGQLFRDHFGIFRRDLVTAPTPTPPG